MRVKSTNHFKMHLRRNAVVALPGLWFFWFGCVTSVFACICGSAPTCERFNFGGAVFVGKAVRVEQENRGSFVNEITIFEIKELFSGERAKTIRVRNKVGGFDCSYEFETGRTYLVFAGGNKAEGFGTGFCNGNLPIEAAAEEVAELRTLSKSRGNGRLLGTVLEEFANRPRNEERAPIKDVVLNITEVDTRRKYSARTNEAGRYEISIPPGTYQIDPVTPSHAILTINSTDDEEPMRVKSGGCSEGYFVFSNNSLVSGRLLDIEGKPVKNARVELVSVDNQSSYHGGMSSESNEDGEFTIEHIPTGKYTLSINYNSNPEPEYPFPTTFYPGQSDRSKAKVVEIALGGRIEGLSWSLPPRLNEGSISGTVLMEDGAPAVGAEIKLFDMAFPGFYAGCFLSEARTTYGDTPVVSISVTSSGSACDLKSDSNGAFSLTAYSGRTYRLEASMTGTSQNQQIEYTGSSEPFALTELPTRTTLILKKK